MGLRALTRRIGRLEKATKPTPSPFVLLYGSFDNWVEREVLPGIESGKLDRRDMVEVVTHLRAWETRGIWDPAVAQSDKRGR